MIRFVLASGSPRRKEILESLRLSFQIEKSDAEETIEVAMPPELTVEQLSLRKAADVAARQTEDALVIGADTLVVLDGEILTKPKDRQDAVRMLSALSGRMHRVLTGLSVIRTSDGKGVSVYEETEVYFRTLSQEQILRYIETGEPMDKAGGYGIQGKGSLLVEKINGDYFNVVGLPACRLAKLLAEEFDCDLFDSSSI